VDLELSKRRVDSQALAATMKARACSRLSSLVALSMYETTATFPSFPTTNSRAIAPVIMVRRPVFSAGGIITWLELKLEAVLHPRPHCAQ
jgi:hypothetical protein